MLLAGGVAEDVEDVDVVRTFCELVVVVGARLVGTGVSSFAKSKQLASVPSPIRTDTLEVSPSLSVTVICTSAPSGKFMRKT